MPTFCIERVDVSRATVEANSAEEALWIAENHPDLWDIDIGDTTVEEEA